MANTGATGQAGSARAGIAAEFAAVVIETPAPEPPTVTAASRAEIVVGPITPIARALAVAT